MPGSLRAEQIESLLLPYLDGVLGAPSGMFERFAQYLELLMRWNARTSLTSIRDADQIVRRHFGESLFAARHLGSCKTVLDFGSGAGFPGLPLQILRPELRVTLAESQNKKATFLREVVRSLRLETEVWAARVEAMPPGKLFDMVTLRAVDDMDMAVEQAASRARYGVLMLSTIQHSWKVPAEFVLAESIPIPQSQNGRVIILNRTEN